LRKVYQANYNGMSLRQAGFFGRPGLLGSRQQSEAMSDSITLFGTQPIAEPLPPPPEQPFLPDAYRLEGSAERTGVVAGSPGVVFIEVTNRCNLLCETCPRTYFTREPLKTLAFDEFQTIAEHFPEMRRCALHGIGEPLLNRELPRMLEYLKGCGVEVLFNSNGTLLSSAWQEALVRSRLDEYRCSVDGARPETYARIRGADLLHKVVEGLAGLVRTKARLNAAVPRISIWCVATRENLGELPDLVRLAARLGVPEVYLQRMTYFSQEPERQYGMARRELAVFDAVLDQQEEIIAACEALSEQLGVDFRASGARGARGSLAARRPADAAPWQACLRPWTTAYVTANGNCLPCCIAPFSASDYTSLVLGNLLERPFAEIWNASPYRDFRTRLLSADPHPACAGCGVYWSL
jgi:MoaA/NifB/PqqE/SkfB family radical SAM enzyme